MKYNNDVSTEPSLRWRIKISRDRRGARARASTAYLQVHLPRARECIIYTYRREPYLGSLLDHYGDYCSCKASANFLIEPLYTRLPLYIAIPCNRAKIIAPCVPSIYLWLRVCTALGVSIYIYIYIYVLTARQVATLW